MEFENIIYALGFLSFSFLMYRFFLKTKRPAPVEGNWTRAAFQSNIGYWSCVIIGLLAGTMLPNQMDCLIKTKSSKFIEFLKLLGI